MDPLKDLIASLAKLEFGGGMTAEEKDEDITKQLADHYLALIHVICPHYTSVSLDANDLFLLEIDGTSYDLDLRIHHDDTKNTEHRMAIEGILSDLTEDGEDMGEILATVEEILNIR